MEKADLYWQRRLYDLERKVDKLEAKLTALETNPDQIGDYYTVKQFAKAMGCCDLTIIRRLNAGVIAGEKVGRSWRIPKTEMNKIFD